MSADHSDSAPEHLEARRSFNGDVQLGPGPINQHGGRVSIGIDFGNSPDIQVVRCVCGFETDGCEEMVKHLKVVHGATAVTVTPENRRPRR